MANLKQRDVDNYAQLSGKQHVYNRPDTYVGSVEVNDINRLIFNSTFTKFKEHKIFLPSAVIQIFIEILSNATDNYLQSIIQNVDPGIINVTVNKNGYISIENFGLNIKIKKIIPVKGEKMKKIKEVDEDSKDPNALWLPEFIFGTMNTSDNYNDDVKRMSVGRNGIGAKATNIFSKEFIVEVDDPHAKKTLILKWEDNMFVNDEDAHPSFEIKNKKIKEGRTKITYLVDQKYFKLYPLKYTDENDIPIYPDDKDNIYTDDDILLFARICAEASFANKVVINFNDNKFDFSNITKFLNLFDDLDSNFSIDYSWENNDKYKNLTKKEKEKIINLPSSIEDIPQLEIMIYDTPNNGNIISYVNGQKTDKGGIHVKAVTTKIFKKICDEVKAKYKKDNPNVSVKILDKFTPEKVFNHFSLIINSHLSVPAYKGQTKEELVSFKEGNNVVKTIKYEPIQEMYKLGEWKGFNECLLDLKSIDGKDIEKINDNKRKKNVDVRGLDDAEYAGTSITDSRKCTLFITEGDSAKAYICSVIASIKDGSKWFGTIPLRGKIKNLTKAKEKKDGLRKILNADINKSEIKRLIAALGGKVNIEEIVGEYRTKSPNKIDYFNDKKLRDTLRYGSVIIAADADVDGTHIRCLVADLFRVLFPGLLEFGFVKYLKTGVIRLNARNSKEEDLLFYSINQFNEWEKKNSKELKKYYTPEYVKGLGSNENKNIKEDIRKFPFIRMYKDKYSEEKLDLAFSSNVGERKRWMNEAKSIDLEKYINEIVVDEDYYNTFPEKEKQIIILNNNKKDEKTEINIYGENISRIIDGGLRIYNIASISRSIIGYDFFKESQRLAIYHILKKFKYKGKGEPIVLTRIANYVAEQGKYTHGPVSMEKLIILLTEHYVGSNNMPVFMCIGQAGNKKDKVSAQARYIKICLPDWINLIMEEEIIEFVPKKKEEGEDVCPEWIPQVIPIGLINGDNGISTGYSFFTPCYNPLDVCEWYINKCKNKKTSNLIPWYNGYECNNKIKLVERKTKGSNVSSTVESEDEEDGEEDDILKEMLKGKYSVHFEGKFDILERSDDIVKVKITELCPNQFIDSYHEFFSKQKFEYEKTKVPYFCIDSSANYYMHDIRGNSKDKNERALHIKPSIDLVLSSYRPKGYPKNKTESDKFIKGDDFLALNNQVNKKTLRLEKKQNISNIVISNEKGFADVYSDIHDVMDKYYIKMINLYKDFLIHKIKLLENDILESQTRLKFIKHVIDGKINIIKVKPEYVLEKMKEYKIENLINNVNIYKSTNATDFNIEGTEKIEKKYKELEDEIKRMREYTPESFWLEKLEKVKDFLIKNREYSGGEFFCL